MVVMQQRRTASTNPPANGSLEPGRLSVEMSAQPMPRLWVGVDTAIDPTGRRLMFDANTLGGRALSMTAPTDGQVLAWNAGASQWVATTPVAASGFLPLTGGVLTGGLTVSNSGDVLINAPGQLYAAGGINFGTSFASRTGYINSANGGSEFDGPMYIAANLRVGRALAGGANPASGLVLCDVVSPNNIGFNAYYNGAQARWNYVGAGQAAWMGQNPAQGYVFISVFPSNTADAAIPSGTTEADLINFGLLELHQFQNSGRATNYMLLRGNFNNMPGIGTGIGDAVGGTLTTYAVGAASAYALNAYYGTGGNWRFLGGGNAATLQIGGGGVALYSTAAAGTAGGTAAMTQRLNIDNAGNALFYANLSANGSLSCGNGIAPLTNNVGACGSSTNIWASMNVGSTGLFVRDGGSFFNFASSGSLFRLTVSGGGGDVFRADLSATMYTREVTPQDHVAYRVGFWDRFYTEVNATTCFSRSDPTVKRDVSVPPPGALAQVMAIPARRFHYADENEPLSAPYHRGFFSTDVHKVMGGDFAGWSKPTPDATERLAYSELLPVLWQAVQELTKEVRRLKGDKTRGVH